LFPSNFKALKNQPIKFSHFCLQTSPRLDFDHSWVQNFLQSKIILRKIFTESTSKEVCPIYLKKNLSLNEQEYILSIEKNQIKLEAKDSKGFFYGLCEWAFLFKATSNALPCIRLQDKPKMLNRGYMLDVSRCKVPKLSEIKKLIDQLCLLRYNHFQLYIEHTFAFQHHSQVWGDSSPLTGEDLQELDQYCSERFIDLIPNLNSFGHFERWLKHKDYQYLAESPNGFTSPFGDFRSVGSVLKPNQQSLTFIDELYREFLPNFKSKTFNVGCDETFELGQGYSKKRVQKHGLHQIYLKHLLKIQKLVKKHHRKMMFWADILIESPEVIQELPKDIIALIWGYESNHPYQQQCKILKSTKAQYWVCPGSSSWNSIIGRWDNAEINIQMAFQQGFLNNAQGILLTDWGDGGHHQTNPITYPSLIFTAHLAWRGQALSRKQLSVQLEKMYFPDQKHLAENLLKMGTAHTKLNASIMNGNAIHHLLFDTQKIQTPSKKRLQVTLQHLEQLKENLPSTSQLDVKEMQLGLNMSMLGIQKHLSQLGCHSYPEGVARKTLGQFEEVWLERNRVGGLHESSSKLRDALRLS
jgi:hypothetical protein